MENSFAELTHLVEDNNPQEQEKKTWLVYHQAIQQYQPDNAKAYKVLGDALQTLGNLEAAIQSYLRAVAIEPHFVDAYMSLGNVFAKQGRLAEAIIHYFQALAIQPNLALGYWNLSQILQNQNHFEASQACEMIALELQPNLVSAEIHLARGHRSLQQGQVEEAIFSYRKAITLNPNWDEAHACLERALQQKTSPASPAAQWNLEIGNALANQGRLEMAVESYNNAVALHPNYLALVNWNLGLVLQAQGRFQEAIECQQRALALNSSFAGVEVYCELGDLLATQGDHDKAIECYQRALGTRPDWFEVQVKLQKLLTASN